VPPPLYRQAGARACPYPVMPFVRRGPQAKENPRGSVESGTPFVPTPSEGRGVARRGQSPQPAEPVAGAVSALPGSGAVRD
jgi:hypothetical protein